MLEDCRVSTWAAFRSGTNTPSGSFCRAKHKRAERQDAKGVAKA